MSLIIITHYISNKTFQQSLYKTTNKYTINNRIFYFARERNTNVTSFYAVMHASDRCETRSVLSTGLILFRITSLHETRTRERERENKKNWEREKYGEREVERSWRLRFAAPVSFLFAS